MATSHQPPSGHRTCRCPLCAPTACGPGLGTYRRAGVPRGVCGGWGRLAGRGGAGAGAGPLASLHGHVEELKLEEPCEERAVVLQLPGKEEGEEKSGPSRTLSRPTPPPPQGRARPPGPAPTAGCCRPEPPSPKSDQSRRPRRVVWTPWGPRPRSGRAVGAGAARRGPGASWAAGR